MRSFRLLFALALPIGLAAIAVIPRPGLAQESSRLDTVFGLGLPPVERGMISDGSHVPGSPETVRRRAVRAIGAIPDMVGEGGARYRRGRVIVKFRDGVSMPTRLSALSSTSRSASISSRPDYANFDVVQIDPTEDPAAIAQELSKRSDVEYAQPSHRVHTQLVPNDTYYKQLQWNLPLIDMERAWDIQPQAGSSITVAVIDTGIAYANAMLPTTMTVTLPAFTADGVRYPALGRVSIPYAAASQLGPASRFVAPRDFVCGGTTPLDFDGHGTHVAGTIGQLTNDNIGTAGVAFNVKLMPIKVLASVWDVAFGCASDTGGFDEDIARGLRYAADNGAKVANLSLGGPGPSGSSPVMEDAIKYAVGKGVFVAIAVGNEFEDGNPVEQPAEIASRVQGAVSVAAVDPLKHRSYFSNTGSWVELSAPGGSNRGFGDNGFVWQQTFDFTYTDTFNLPPALFTAPRFDVLGIIGYIGTSQATPHVSGVAAMLMQQGITDPAAVEAALERLATDLGDPGRDPQYGFGLIEARNTLRGLGMAK
jgi:serine protease